MSRETKMVVDAVVLAMRERPEDFVIGEHTLKDNKSGLEYWIFSGFVAAGIHRPYQMNFGAVQGWRFHSGLNKFKAWYALNKTSVGGDSK